MKRITKFLCKYFKILACCYIIFIKTFPFYAHAKESLPIDAIINIYNNIEKNCEQIQLYEVNPSDINKLNPGYFTMTENNVAEIKEVQKIIGCETIDGRWGENSQKKFLNYLEKKNDKIIDITNKKYLIYVTKNKLSENEVINKYKQRLNNINQNLLKTKSDNSGNNNNIMFNDSSIETISKKIEKLIAVLQETISKKIEKLIGSLQVDINNNINNLLDPKKNKDDSNFNQLVVSLLNHIKNNVKNLLTILIILVISCVIIIIYSLFISAKGQKKNMEEFNKIYSFIEEKFENIKDIEQIRNEMNKLNKKIEGNIQKDIEELKSVLKEKKIEHINEKILDNKIQNAEINEGIEDKFNQILSFKNELFEKVNNINNILITQNEKGQPSSLLIELFKEIHKLQINQKNSKIINQCEKNYEELTSDEILSDKNELTSAEIDKEEIKKENSIAWLFE